MHEVLVNRLGGLSLPRKSVVRLTDRPDMTIDVYRGRKTTIQQYNIVQSNLTLSQTDVHTFLQSGTISCTNLRAVCSGQRVILYKQDLHTIFANNLKLF